MGFVRTFCRVSYKQFRIKNMWCTIIFLSNRCIDHQEQVPNGRTIDLPCSNPVTGQFVFFVLQDLNAHNILTLCEVEVYSNTAGMIKEPLEGLMEQVSEPSLSLGTLFILSH